MGVLRGFGIIIISIVLFICLLVGGIFASISLSLNYDNVQPKTYSIASEIIKTQIGEETIVNQLMPYLNVYCQTNTEVVQSFGDYTFIFPCSIVGEGYDSIVNYSVNYLVSDFYYKEYNCTFTECFEESDVPLFLVSDYARQFWKSLFFKALIASLILSCAIVLISEKRSNAPILVGSLIIASSLIVLTLEKIGTFIAGAILSPISLALSKENMNVIISQIVAMFFSDSSKVFLWMFIVGLVLIVVGIVLKITGIGFKIGEKIEEIKGKIKGEENISKSEVREIVKQEISKKNLPNKKKK
jgi:hypothetical protein